MTEQVIITIITALQAVTIAGIGALGLRMHRVGKDSAAARDDSAAARIELTNNHGSSMRDAVDRVETKLDTIEQQQNANTTKINTVETRLGDHITQSETILQLITKGKR